MMDVAFCNLRYVLFCINQGLMYPKRHQRKKILFAFWRQYVSLFASIAALFSPHIWPIEVLGEPNRAQAIGLEPRNNAGLPSLPHWAIINGVKFATVILVYLSYFNYSNYTFSFDFLVVEYCRSTTETLQTNISYFIRGFTQKMLCLFFNNQ